MTFETLTTNCSYIMGKQELKRKETAVVSPNGEGKQYEQTLTVDDTCLPSACPLLNTTLFMGMLVIGCYILNGCIKERTRTSS